MADLMLPGMTNAAFRAHLETYRRVDEFAAYVLEHAPVEEHRGNGPKAWREAYVAAKWAMRRGLANRMLRLTPDSSPKGDLECMDQGANSIFEIAEIVDAEFQMQMAARPDDQHYIPAELLDGTFARRRIPEIISAKAGKKYDQGTGLILYLSRSPLGEFETIGLVPDIGAIFSEIWLLMDGQVFDLHRGGSLPVAPARRLNYWAACVAIGEEDSARIWPNDVRR